MFPGVTRARTMIATLPSELERSRRVYRISPAAARVILFFPVIVTVVVAVLWSSPPLHQTARWLLKENGVIEWLTFFAFIAGGLLGLRLAARAKNHGESKRVYGTYLAISLLLLIAGMEEISWGQRIFGFATPATIQETNLQGELNVHNLPWLQDLHSFFFACFAVVGLLATWLSRRYEIRKIPVPMLLFPYLAVVLVVGGLDYYTDSFPIQLQFDILMGTLSEVVEMLMALCGFLYVALNARMLEQEWRENHTTP